MDINHAVEEAKLRDMVLVDVRTKEEYKNGHIPGAINIPLNETSKINLKKDKEYGLYCLSGQRAKIAQKILDERGYQVHAIGGINEWDGKIVK